MKEKAVVAVVHRKEVPGRPENYDDKSIEIIRGMLREAVDYLGGIRKFVHSGDKVVIKPNVFWPISSETALNTDPRVVEALIRLIREEVSDVGEIRIWEASAAGWQVPNISTFDCYKASGFTKMAEKMSVKLMDGETDEATRVGVPGARVLFYFDLPKTLEKADCYISVPKLKTHNETLMTGAIKNQQGSIKSYDKYRFHAKDLPYKLVDIYRVLRPNLTIMDALWVLQGQGPQSYFPEDLIKNMNLILAGGDCVALDAVATAIMCYDPLEVETTRIANFEGLGIGELSNIAVKGAPVEKVKRPFKRSSVSLFALYPNIDVYMHGGCEGCPHTTRFALDRLATEGIISKLDKPINLILGFNTQVPDNLSWERTLVIGDCAKEHAKRARVFFPGCPHTMASVTVSATIKALVEKHQVPDWSFLPYHLRPIYRKGDFLSPQG
jgi:uncharacterized protein (DUF362 family)